MEDINNKKRFLFLFLGCIFLFSLMCIAGIISGSKGTSAADGDVTCPNGYKSQYYNGHFQIGTGASNYYDYYCCPEPVESQQYDIIYVHGKLYCFNYRPKINGAIIETRFSYWNLDSSVDNPNTDSGCTTYYLNDAIVEDENERDQLCKAKYGNSWKYDDFVSDRQWTCETSYKNCSVPVKNTLEKSESYIATFYDYAGEQYGEPEECDYSLETGECVVSSNILKYSTGWGKTRDCVNGVEEIALTEDTNLYACYPERTKKACFENYSGVHIWASYGDILNEYYNNDNDIWESLVEDVNDEENCLKDNEANEAVVKFACSPHDVSNGNEINGSISNCEEIEKECSFAIGLDGTPNSSCSITTPGSKSLSGYEFKGWGDAKCDNLVSSNNKLTVSDKISMRYPCFSATENEPGDDPVKKSYVVKFKDYDDTVLYETTCEASDDDYCDVEAYDGLDDRTGYTFLGWSTDGNNCDSGNHWKNSKRISKDTTFYACYDKNSPMTDGDGPSTGTNVDENQQTGDISIFVVLMIGFIAIVYSIYYFSYMKKTSK